MSYDDYFMSEGKKVKRVLEEREKDHNKTRRQLGVYPWNEIYDLDKPLVKLKIESLRNFFLNMKINLIMFNKGVILIAL